MIEPSAIPAALPDALIEQKLNASFILGDGELQFLEGPDAEIKSKVSLSYVWLPRSRVRAVVDDGRESHGMAFLKRVFTEPRSLGEKVEITIGNSTGRGLLLVRGETESGLDATVNGAFKLESGEPLSKLTLKLPNFPKFHGSWIHYAERSRANGRLSLKCDRWEVIVDQVVNNSDIQSELRSNEGYAITHVANASTASGGTFSVDSAEQLIDCLSYFFAFAAGRWCGPAGICGIGESGAVEYRELSARRVDSYTPVQCWHTHRHGESLRSFGHCSGISGKNHMPVRC